jgi:hypothetical protein
MNNSQQLVRDLATGEVTSLVSGLGRWALGRTSNCASDTDSFDLLHILKVPGALKI